MSEDKDHVKQIRTNEAQVHQQNAPPILSSVPESQGTEQQLVEAKHALDVRTGELTASLSLLTATLESTGDGIVAWDLSGKAISYNSKFAAMWQFPEAFLQRRDQREMMAYAAPQVKDSERFMRLVMAHQQEPQVEAFDIFELKDGRTFERYCFPLFVDHKCVGAVVNLRDITQRQQAEASLRLSEQKYRLLMTTAGDAFLIFDEEHIIREVNAALSTIFGYEPNEVIGQSFFGFVHPDDEALTIAYIRHSQAANDTQSFENRYLCKDGSYKWLAWRIKAVAAGQSVYAIARDISKQKSLEDEIEALAQKTERRERMLSTTLASISDFSYVFDREGRFVFANQPLLNLWGIELEEAVGKNFFELGEPYGYPADLAQKLHQQVQQVFETGQRLTDETFYRGPDGVESYYEYIFSPVFRAEGIVDFVVGATRDITERKKVAQALDVAMRQLERSNNELQQFASIASHDLQEPLRAIQAFGERLQTKYSAALSEEANDYLTRMINAAGRMRSLIQDLLAYSRVTTHVRPFTTVDLGKTIEALLPDLVRRLEESAGRIEVGALPRVEADPMQMRQLFQNLIANALKFHREGEPPLVKIYLAPEAHVNNDTVICIVVEDNGIGFNEKYAERIFAPFERLHNQNQYGGTGIGLAICRKIVERHKGRISVVSVPGQGSQFLIALPLKQSDA